MADNGGELLLLTAGKRVGSVACQLGHLNVFVPFKLIIYFTIQLFSSIHFLPFDCVLSSGQDVAFKTPVKRVLRQHILSEIDPVATRNTTATNVYSPIVRFLTPSKESKCSCGHWKTVLYCGEDLKYLILYVKKMCLVYLIHGRSFSPSLDELAIPVLNGLFMIFLTADCSVMNNQLAVGVALMEIGKSHPGIKVLTSHLCFLYYMRACVCFLCPDVKFSDRGNVLMSPEQCVFSFGSIDPLAEDEEDDIFNP